MFKSEDDRHATINALRVAAERYADDAKWLRDNNGDLRLTQQFERQETEARRIAEYLEEESD